MKVIIAGGRTQSKENVRHAIRQSPFYEEITEVVCGGARGADTEGRLWAEEQKIPVKMFPAEWDKHGKSAGYIRNEAMADYADILIAVWDGLIKGTGHMINLARKKGLKIHIYMTTQNINISDDF